MKRILSVFLMFVLLLLIGCNDITEAPLDDTTNNITDSPTNKVTNSRPIYPIIRLKVIPMKMQIPSRILSIKSGTMGNLRSQNT